MASTIKRQHCINCMFSSWYHNFRSITFRSKIIKLPEEFVTYLTSDGIILPDDVTTKYSNDLEEITDSEDDSWEEDTTVLPTNNLPSFPELKQEIEDAIKSLGGEVFPKLNWSSPKDAAWISHNGTLMCTTFNDICLLLKSSDFITNDLTNAYKFCEDTTPHANNQFELVLRRYENIAPGMEFRCFVKDNKLVGITQRHISTYFDYLVRNKIKIQNDIVDFFNSKIKGRFSDVSYIFDIYLDSSRIYLMDFNPFGCISDSMLFTWEELETENINPSGDDFFRIVTISNNIQPSPFIRYAVPRDIVDLTCGEDMSKMIDLLKLRDLVSKPGESGTDDLDGNT